MRKPLAILTRATDFMKDNTFGLSYVISFDVRPDGSCYYRMDNNFDYDLSPEEMKVINRYKFKPRSKKPHGNPLRSGRSRR